jgi:hypothetical protein
LDLEAADMGDLPDDEQMAEIARDGEAGAASLGEEVSDVSAAVEAMPESQSKEWVFYSLAGVIIVLGGMAFAATVYLKRRAQ